MKTKTATEIDWNLIELSEIYESFGMVLDLLSEDFKRAEQLIDAAIDRGASPASMTKPIKEFAIELHAFCEAIDSLEDNKAEKELSS